MKYRHSNAHFYSLRYSMNYYYLLAENDLYLHSNVYHRLSNHTDISMKNYFSGISRNSFHPQKFLISLRTHLKFKLHLNLKLFKLHHIWHHNIDYWWCFLCKFGNIMVYYDISLNCITENKRILVLMTDLSHTKYEGVHISLQRSK